jgi:hypothetical protein
VSDQPLHQQHSIPIASKPRAWQLTALLNVGSLALALCWLALIASTLTTHVDDFKLYWHAAVNLRQLGDPYATTPEPGTLVLPPVESGGTLIGPYMYPPLLAYLVQPLAALDLYQAQRVWFAINCLALGMLIRLAIQVSGSDLAHRHWGVVVLGTVLAPPTRLSLQLGQVSILMALLLVAAFALRRRAAPISGALLALATLIKLYPGFLGLFYSSRRSRTVAWWGLAAGALLLALSAMIYGLAPYQNYLHKNVQSNFYPYAAEFNISLVGFWDRLLAASSYAQPLATWPGLARALAALCSIGVVGVCLRAGRDAADEPTHLLQYSAWLCGMLLLSPINGYYNLVLLLLPLLAALSHLERHPYRQATHWLILAGALICIPPGWTQARPALYDALHRGPGLFLLTPAIYGLAIYLGLLAFLAHRSTAQATTRF